MKQQDLLVFELQKYLFGETSFSEFHDWFVPFTWSPPKSVVTLARTIELRIAEYTASHCSENELKQVLRKELENNV